MGITKSDKFTEAQNRLANIAKVLGHPARIAIIQHLFKIDSCICGDLVNEIGLAQPTISQHLKVLKSVGIIQGSISGTSVCYCIDQDEWNNLSEIIGQFLSQKANTVDDVCC
ncbi:ArsR family transcriptional regulator [Bizionia argentinensis JUB59]|uniref:ArsR family transcriptional regulator n=1 Tax=Bizionia argentinensis JUB59 TaxID=1046627 RepID=G2E9K0_9FLAO|nr:metalloregulator ArsR/SmtB family transcription factor [Bizionia argentinensis]EGV44863.1 ArsR family transcriptional regulator [Bizionia argentinensis JUB59]